MILVSINRCCVLLLLIFCSTSLSAQIQLAFSGTPTLTGTAGTVGAKYTYANIGTSGSITIKGVIEIIAISGASLDNIDGPASAGGLDQAFQPVISGSQTSGNCWSIQFRISFFDASTNAAITLSSFRSSGVDIDGNGGTLREYNTFVGPDSYTLDNPTNLTVTNTAGAYKFLSPSSSYAGIALSQTNVAVTCVYSNRASVDLIIGSCCVGGSCSVASGSGRQHSINFYDAITYTSPTVVLPVTLLQLSATRKSRGVQLNWSTSDETNFSHFTIQRSTDGKSFSDVAAVPSQGTAHQYSYMDQSIPTGVVYYRLKMVDQDDKFLYSQILRINAEIDESGNVSIYPNPVSDALNVRVVSQTNQTVKINVFDEVGILIRSFSRNIEQGVNIIPLDAQLLNKRGLYIFQVVSNNGSRSVRGWKL